MQKADEHEEQRRVALSRNRVGTGDGGRKEKGRRQQTLRKRGGGDFKKIREKADTSKRKCATHWGGGWGGKERKKSQKANARVGNPKKNGTVLTL